MLGKGFRAGRAVAGLLPPLPAVGGPGGRGSRCDSMEPRVEAGARPGTRWGPGPASVLLSSGEVTCVTGVETPGSEGKAAQDSFSSGFFHQLSAVPFPSFLLS